MKILYLLLHDFRFANWTLDIFLSRYHFSKAYAYHLGTKGHEVHLITLHQAVKRPRTYTYKHYTLHILPSNLKFPPLLSFGNAHSYYLPQYIKHIIGNNVDIIHIHNYWIWSTPYVILLLKHIDKNARIVVQYHGETDPSKTLRAIILRKIYTYPDIYLVSRDYEISFLKKHVLKKHWSKKIVKFPNVGADDNTFKPTKNKTTTPSITYVGRIMHERKNKFPFILLKLARKKALKNVNFYLVGDGPLLNLFQAYVKKYRLKNVILTGYLPVSKVVEHMSKSWLYFYPGYLERADGFWDGAVKEALLCGTPTVALNMNKNQKNIVEDTMGYLLPSTTLDTIAASLWELFNKRKNSIIQKSSKIVKNAKAFSWKNIADKLEKIYQKLL